VNPRAAVVALGLTALTALSASPSLAADSHSPIAGSGSSWSANAVNQWVADVEPNGLQVVFTSSGSAIGRKDFANRTVDMAVTDIGFQGKDKLTGQDDTPQGRDFAYLPIVAGGTGFPYHLEVAGKLVRDLRLSGPTLAKIFTNNISNWNDPAITADNNGRQLPSKPIIPVVHSEGSGSSAQFTTYLNSVYASLWQPFYGRDGFTEYFPKKGDAIAQNGSDGVMNYVASSAADGAIGYDEYSYALGKDYPVAKIENSAGYFTLPTQYNVAVALTQAKINTDKASDKYLLQDLSNVYTYNDQRTYPLSSYSYMVIPTAADDARMTTAKRQTLADYLFYSICEGQKEVGPIGYSPLPVNLAQASFEQINKLKDADSGVNLNERDITKCKNPTFVAGQPSRNYLAEVAPKPPACDKQGAGPCGATAPAVGNPDSSGRPPAVGGTPIGKGSRGGGTTGTTGSAGSGTTGSTSGPGRGSGSSGTPLLDPLTGQVIPGSGTAGTSGGGAIDPTLGGTNGNVQLQAVPTELASSRRPVSPAVLGPLAVLLLIGAVIAPPLLARRQTASGGGA
jgi:phosphate transport system substrate-binding protein